jgi:hypothetical protein
MCDSIRSPALPEVALAILPKSLHFFIFLVYVSGALLSALPGESCLEVSQSRPRGSELRWIQGTALSSNQ